MRSRRLAPVLAVLALLTACSSDDGDAGSDATTTTEQGPTTTLVVAKPSAYAKLVVQIDDHLRMLQQNARPCLEGSKDRCVGTALDSFELMDDDANALAVFLRSSANRDDVMYVGELPAELVALFDESINVSADATAKIEAAQAACLPEFPPECAGAIDAMKSALDEILKTMNEWRRHL